VGLQYPFPTLRTADEFFATHDDDIIYPIKVLTTYITFIDRSFIKAETELYPGLAMFGETIEELPCAHEALQTECGIPTGDLEAMTAAAVPLLASVADFIPQIMAVGKKLIEYMVWLYSEENPLFHHFFQGTVYASVFAALGKVLRMLYTLSSLLSENPALPEGWERLRKMLFGITKEPGTYDATPDDITLAENALLKIHRILFNEIDVLTVFFE
jgi:hypothetical protein